MKFRLLWLVVAIALGACAAQGRRDATGVSTGSSSPTKPCVDRDLDGFGANCKAGTDCDDHDPAIHQGCLRCAVPNDGCGCARGTRPMQCFLDKTQAKDGTVMCNEGTRYCRDGVWSGCESINSYPLPSRPAGTALINADAGPVQCNDCNVACYRITDNLDPVDGGLNNTGSNVDWATGGGLTLGLNPDGGPPDAGGGPTSVVSSNPPPCTPGVGLDLDCDGIPNQFDPYPTTPPFDTANPTIFLDIAPGQTGTGQIDLNFFVNSADVYFLVDQTGSMAEERDQIKHDLTTGDFVNDAAYNCADYDFDRQPNNELKTQGIIGAIKCRIRDANFGAGFFREIPFLGYAPDDQIAFANYQDVTGSVSSVLAAVNRFTTIGNLDWPEASMVGLHNLLTGNGMYFGTTKRSIPPRTDCPASKWGYPCFRQNAVPVVVMFTDAELHNGPDNNTYAYPNSFNITSGSDNQIHPVANTNENFNSGANLGDLTTTYTTFSGDTTNMVSDFSASLVGSSCLSSGAGNDALFRFQLTQQKAVTIETTGSEFDTVLGLFTGIPGSPSDLMASSNGNETGTNALDMGEVHGNYVRVAGNTSGMAADYQWSDVGCNAATSAKDAVFKFNLASQTQVAIDTSGSAFDTVVGVYNAAPALPPSYTASGNTNDNFSTAYAVGDVYNQLKAFSGDTSAAGLTADYSNAQVGCNANDSSKDAVYSFSLSSATRVRISSEGSGFDTVLGLFDNGTSPVGSGTVPTTADTQTAAYSIGTLDGKIFNLTGTTAGMVADYAGLGCSSSDTSNDAVVKFHLDTPRDVQIDTIGTTWDTALGLYNQSNFDSFVSQAVTNTNEIYASATDLGTVNAQDVRVTGGTTTSMHGDYSTSTVSCTTSTSAPDAAYKFHLDTATTMRVDLDGSSFDTVLSLQNGAGAPVETTMALSSNTNDNQATAFVVGNINNNSLVWTGNDSSLAHDYNIACNTDGLSRDAVFQFTVSSTTQVQLDTNGTSWDTTIGLYPATISADPTITDLGTTNSTVATAKDLGSLDGQHFTYTGTTVGAGHEWTDNHCSTATTAEDSYFKFTLSAPKNVTISTSGSSYSASVLLYKDVPSASTYQGCNSSSLTMSSLAAGTYYVVVKGTNTCSHGTYKLDIKDTAAASNQITCDDDGGSGLQSSITTTLSPGTYNLVVTGWHSSSSYQGAYTVRFRDLGWWNSFVELQCNDNISGSNTSSKIERALSAGDYWFVVKGRASTNKGSYKLRVLDVSHPPVGPAPATCDDNGGGGTQSKITRTALAAGDYWVVVKGHSATDAGSYKLNIKDLSATASGALIQCDDNGGDNPQSMIERDLNVGSYQVVVKGASASAQGAYKLSFRDVTSKPISRLACDDNGGGGTTSYLEQNLAAGTYYVALKGHGTTSSGAYSLSLRDVTSRPLVSTACNDNGSSYNTSKIATTLNPGTYYVAVKGKDANAKGTYLLSLGGGTTHSSTYVPPIWSNTLAAIQSTQAHVISILSCHDDPAYGDNGFNQDCVHTRAQAVSLANASNALGANLQPLVFDIDSNGTGLSTAVVNAVSQLAKYLEMDVTVRVVFDPDVNPGFGVTVRAIDAPGDGCQGLVGITHQKCAPGATPRFQIDFQNPLAPNSVPLNPNDPKGGYNFRAELIGDNQFIVDKVPIYIIPQSVQGTMGPPPPPQYYPSGKYWQDTGSPGCKGNQAPDWRDLSWNAAVYANTSITFSACTAQSKAELATCTPHAIASVSGTGACTSSANCPVGYCDTALGVCQIATAGACTSNSQCPVNAFCDSGSGKCTFNGQPVYIGAALGADNFKSFIRMQIDLNATPPYASPPVLHSWDMTYLCNQVL